MPVTRIEFGRIKGRGDGQQENNDETVLGVFQLFFNTTRTRVRSRYRPPSAGVHSGQMGWTRRRRKPDSGLGRTQDYRTRWTHEDWVDSDSFAQKMEREVGQPSIGYQTRWLSAETVSGISPDGPDSTTSGSDIPESHSDRPPEVEYSERY